MLSAQAVVVSNPLKAPPEGFPYAGHIDQAGRAIYMGNGWALTAKHMGAQKLTIQDRVLDPAGESKDVGGTDLLLYRVNNAPKMAMPRIVSAPPELGTKVLFVGGGRTAVAGEKRWYFYEGKEVVKAPEGSGQSDTERVIKEFRPINGEMRSLQGPIYHGFDLSSKRATNWGMNTVKRIEKNFTGAHIKDSTVLVTQFHEGPDNAQAVQFDSGGLVFSQDGDGEWALAGIISAMNAFEGQGRNRVIYGNETFSVSLDAYKGYIEQTVGVLASPPRKVQPSIENPSRIQGRVLFSTPEAPTLAYTSSAVAGLLFMAGRKWVRR